MSKKRKINRFAIVFFIIGIISGICLFLFVSYSSNLEAVNQKNSDVIFTIKQGDSSEVILENLENKGLIQDAFYAELYLKFNSELSDFKAGNYSLNDSMNVNEILTRLNDSKNAVNDDVLITIPEGTWAKNIAAIFENKLGIDQNELLDLWNDDSYLETLIDEYEFLTDDILNDDLNVKLEGYLFPETYYFASGSSAKQATKKLLDQTEKIYNKYIDDFNSSEYSVHELFTLASITQFESGQSADNKIISGVWFNRLEQGMPLQSSVTICYALYDYDHWLDCEVNPDIESPFNTYKYSGIPIGPIANPGEDAILSVVQAVDTDYLYFMADVYGDGTVYYAETYAEHLENVNKYLR